MLMVEAITAALGAVLLAGVVAWKLIGSTYAADLRTLCDAERQSAHTLETDMPQVSRWVRAHLKTPEGNRLFWELRNGELPSRAKRLRTEASAVGIVTCPTVRSYLDLAALAEYRRDVQRICSSVTFPGFADLDDDSRLGALEDWIETHAATERTKSLADPLRRAPSPQRPAILSAAAHEAGVFSCDVAKVLDLPRPPP
jgi:hypothetical protein